MVRRFFASITCVLNHLAWCDRNEKIPVVYWDNRCLYYEPSGFNGSNNAWEYYFEPVSNLQIRPPTQITLTFIADGAGGIDFSVDHFSDEQRNYAAYLIDKYIKIKPIVQQKIDQFYYDNMYGKKTVGIHLRGTDKGVEEKLVTPEKIIEKALACADSDAQFFIATDEQRLLERMIQLLKGRTVIYYDCYRSDNGRPVHQRRPKPSQAQVGEDVLAEAALLARCDHLVHTLSNVSTGALYFNPTLEHTLVRQDF